MIGLILCLPLLVSAQNTLLFELTHPELTTTSYLFGTVHVQDEAAFNFNDSVFWAIEQVDKAEFELDLNQNILRSQILKEVKNTFDEDFKERAEVYITEDLLPALMENYTPSELSENISTKLIPFLQDFVTKRLQADNRSMFVDRYLQQYAELQGKEIVGIEGYEEQLSALLGDLNEMRFDGTTVVILEALQKEEFSSKLINYFGSTDVMIEAYHKHDLDELCKLIATGSEVNNQLVKNLYKRIFYDRNELMFERTKNDVREGSTFIAVGAGHLCGDNGLLKQYQDAGYSIRPMDITIKDKGMHFSWIPYRSGNFSIDVIEDALLNEEYSSGTDFYFMPYVNTIRDEVLLTKKGLVCFKVKVNTVESSDETEEITLDSRERYEEVYEITPEEESEAILIEEVPEHTSEVTYEEEAEKVPLLDNNDIAFTDIDNQENDKNRIYESWNVTDIAAFQEGDQDLSEYLSETIIYPTEALEEGVEGTVVVMFIINKEGDVTDISTLTKNGYGLEEEATRVIGLTSGMWTPAKLRDKPVNMRFRVPVRFTLFDDVETIDDNSDVSITKDLVSEPIIDRKVPESTDDEELEYYTPEETQDDVEIEDIEPVKNKSKIKLTDEQEEWLGELGDSLKTHMKAVAAISRGNMGGMRSMSDTTTIEINGQNCTMITRHGMMAISKRVTYETDNATYYIEALGDPALIKSEEINRFFTSFELNE